MKRLRDEMFKDRQEEKLHKLGVYIPHSWYESLATYAKMKTMQLRRRVLVSDLIREAIQVLFIAKVKK